MFRMVFFSPTVLLVYNNFGPDCNLLQVFDNSVLKMLFSRLRTFALFFIVSALFVCASPVDHTALDARASQATVLDVVTTHAGILKKLRNKIKQWLSRLSLSSTWFPLS
jgi:hypothetical protein